MQRKQPLDAELVRQWVVAAHMDPGRVRTLYDTTPELLHSVHNWGGGDWVTNLLQKI
ncbi:MAG: hypothetical protein ACRC5C_10245 [Bacilli bacterium]